MKTQSKEIQEQKRTNQLLKTRKMIAEFLREKNIPFQIISCENGKYYNNCEVDKWLKIAISIHQNELSVYQQSLIVETYLNYIDL